MPELGLFEIFFGPPWNESSRLSLAAFLKEHGFQYYIYGPKADPYLRKKWAEDWPQEYVAGLRSLAAGFQRSGVRFGVALSPFGLHERSSRENERLLTEKMAILSDVGVQELGLFFDDMPSHEGMAELQLEAADIVLACTSSRILFCPSYYSFDPILDKVFGARPPSYLEEIARHLPLKVEILWTGEKVISEEITADHLLQVRELLRRKPFICDNIFANDGPKNCKYLKLRPPSGRSAEAFAAASSWAFNPMNQAELSKLVLLASMKVARGLERDPQSALAQAIRELASPQLAAFLLRERELFLSAGLDAIDESTRAKLSVELKTLRDPAAVEIRDWLEGRFQVGSECLTD